MIKLIQGDCLVELKKLEDNSIDAVICDPPYGLSFMGKKWDYDVPSVEIWAECLRVLKPGGYLLAFAGTRTQHRMAVRIEDAGFEIRDMIAWVYGSGFPKSLNIGKSVDKLQGNEREVLGNNPNHRPNSPKDNSKGDFNPNSEGNKILTKGTSEWEGWGTALKPALEPITVARKPLAEKTVAENCLKWGTGGINIDECRVEIPEGDNSGWSGSETWNEDSTFTEKGNCTSRTKPTGRFPANLVLEDCEEVRECFPNKSERFFKSIIYQAKASKSERNKGIDCYLTVKYNGSIINNNKTLCEEENMVAVQLLQRVISEPTVSFSTGESGESITVQCHKDSLSTILTESKRIIGLKIYNLLTHSLTSESTQDAKLETENGGSLAESVADLKRWILTTTKGNQELALGASRVVLKMLSLISEEENWKPATNFHSTVKPIALMEYLIKLVSREGSAVLDPFMGSGSTGIAAKNLNRNFIGIELDEEYLKIAKARIENTSSQLKIG